MTFWLDEQLDPDLAAWLGGTFKIVVKPIREIGLRTAKDVELLKAARRFVEIVIVTKDDDFLELLANHGVPPQIVWLHFPNMPTLRMQSLLSMTFAEAIRLITAGEPLVEITEAGTFVP